MFSYWSQYSQSEIDSMHGVEPDFEQEAFWDLEDALDWARDEEAGEDEECL